MMNILLICCIIKQYNITSKENKDVHKVHILKVIFALNECTHTGSLGNNSQKIKYVILMIKYNNIYYTDNNI